MMKKKIWLVSAFLIGLIIGLLLLEFSLRPFLEPTYSLKHKYGWIDEPGVYIDPIYDTKDNYRNLTVEFFEGGFKRWASTETNKTKILLIGDSYTHMFYASNGEEYYSYLENEFPWAEFFVFGGTSYGTYQEYLVLDDYYETIQPDIVILQTISNDHIDNLYDYKKKYYPYVNFEYRPYLINNKTQYKIAIPGTVLK